MSNFRVWLFRGLVAAAAGLMVTSVIMPWWTANILTPRVGPEPEILVINIYQYGIPRSPSAGYWATDVTPFYQTVLAWIYIAASVGLILFSTWLKGRKGQFLLGGVGLIYIAYAAIAAFVVIAGRTGDFGISLQGLSAFKHQGHELIAIASLRFGYYLAYASALTCIALALFRDTIVGRAKLAG